jgi:methyl-accepting chemotaxis protein
VTEVKPGEQRLFEEVINLPLAPFKAMTGVDRTASAIYGLRDSTDHITDVVEELPESARWQLLLLLMEMEETKVVKTFLESMSKFSNSSVRFADTAEKLPKQLRQELSILIKEIDNKQANLQTTLEKTEKASIAIEKTLGQAEKVAVSFKTTAESVNQAAAAWEKAAIATDSVSVLAEFKQFRTPRKDATKKSPFKISDYRDTAESVGKTVNEMKDLTAEIRKLIESEQLSEYSSMPLTITNLMVWRLSQFVFLIFILALVYRIVTVRYLKNSK